MHSKTVVVLHAHPDDEAIFTGITMARLVSHGWRVVLVVATGGEEGEPLVPIGPGADLAHIRRDEALEAARLLGVQRTVFLHHRDSGMIGSQANEHPDAFCRVDVEACARRLAQLIEQEGAQCLLHYDDDGIYGHPDHVAVHRVGARAAELADVTSYEATVDLEHLHFVATHVVEGAEPRMGRPNVGRVSVEITTALTGTSTEVALKREAMRVHVSQIGPEVIDAHGFDETYGSEWFIRRGPAGVLETLGNTHLIV